MWLSGSDPGMSVLCSCPASDSTLIIHDIRVLHVRGQVLQIDISILLGSPWLSQYRIFTAQTVSRSLLSLYSVEPQILMIGNLLLLPCELNEPVSVFSMGQIPPLYFFQCLEILTFNLILNTVSVGLVSSVSAYCIWSICCHVYLKEIIIKWGMHKLCRLLRRLPSGRILLWTSSISWSPPTVIYRASVYQALP